MRKSQINNLVFLSVFSIALLIFWGAILLAQHEAVRLAPMGWQHQGMMHQEGQEQPQAQATCPHQKMMAEMRASDEELQALVEKMENSSTEERKVEAIEDLLVKLVESRSEMHQNMMAGMPGMMQHMHSGGAGEAMMDCPMMKEHGASSESSADAQAGHKH